VLAVAVALGVDHDHHRTQKCFLPIKDIHQKMPGNAEEEPGFPPYEAGVNLGLILAE